jgi:hypothetical protein
MSTTPNDYHSKFDEFYSDHNKITTTPTTFSNEFNEQQSKILRKC